MASQPEDRSVHTLMSCDNVPGNGDVARRALVSFARLQERAQAEWITESVAFPSSMVDRITPGTTEADRDVLAEQTAPEPGEPLRIG